jgi:hypothetical protein
VSETPRGPFVPLPMHPTGGAEAPEAKTPPSREVRVVYVRYRDPNPLEFPDRPERLPGPIFHAAGVLLREDDEFLALGEVAFAEENPPMVQRYGVDLFPAYRNVLTIPKSTIVERRDVVV